MRKLLLAGAATIGIIAAPAVLSAQATTEARTSASVAADLDLTADQQAMYDTWSDEWQAAFGRLSPEHRTEFWTLTPEQRTYFWTLTPRQQETYWVLTPEQRVQIMGMTPQARANAWTSIQAQMAAGANNSQTSVTARTGGDVSASASTPATVVRTVPGNLTPPPASAMNKTYPVCTRRVQDNCQNPGEGGAPGRSRALQYWPGEPASERKN